MPIGTLLTACREVAGSDARFTWVSEAFLLEHEVAPFTELPLWIPAASDGFNAFNIDKALAAGLAFRPVVDTARDTLAWASRRSGHVWRNGLTPEREAQLLEAWQKASPDPISRD